MARNFSPNISKKEACDKRRAEQSAKLKMMRGMMSKDQISQSQMREDKAGQKSRTLVLQLSVPEKSR
jgi:hypothetical protein